VGKPVIQRVIDGVAPPGPQAALELRCSSRSLSRTSALVRLVTFLRMRVPAGVKPKLTAPMYRLLDESQ
jgi:hypothetical protein